MRAATGKECKW